MLGLVQLVERFNELEHDLPPDWTEARFVLNVADDARCDRAAALLGPTNPGRLGQTIRLSVVRGGAAGVGPEGVRRLLRRLDKEGIAAGLELAGAEKAVPPELRGREQLADAWRRALDGLPSDWSDIYAEVRLDSTDYVEPGALLLAPVNPSRSGPAALRFRCAHHFGYGVAPEMARRCFERCDAQGITGEVEILHALSDTHPVATQGPVWLIGGRSV
jgi:hypothetical protein